MHNKFKRIIYGWLTIILMLSFIGIAGGSLVKIGKADFVFQPKSNIQPIKIELKSFNPIKFYGE